MHAWPRGITVPGSFRRTDQRNHATNKEKKQIGEAIKAYGQKRKLRKKKRVLNYQHRRFS